MIPQRQSFGQELPNKNEKLQFKTVNLLEDETEQPLIFKDKDDILEAREKEKKELTLEEARERYYREQEARLGLVIETPLIESENKELNERKAQEAEERKEKRRKRILKRKEKTQNEIAKKLSSLRGTTELINKNFDKKNNRRRAEMAAKRKRRKTGKELNEKDIKVLKLSAKKTSSLAS